MKEIPLGKTTDYPQYYSAEHLFPIPRQEKRDELGIDKQHLPFAGSDIWTGFELSWLNGKGKPQVAIARFFIPCESPNIVESKSFKLYLNSFNQTAFKDTEEVKQVLLSDLGKALGAELNIEILGADDFGKEQIAELPGDNIDDLDVQIDTYSYAPDLLSLSEKKVKVEESLNSHLLKSNCLITSQPDWASVYIRYRGTKISHESLLKYLISFRSHNEFHEQCVERIYTDIMARCKPEQLTVAARYTRRGGLDINPWRSNFETELPDWRLARQ